MICCELASGCDNDGQVTLALGEDIFRVFCMSCAVDQVLYNGARDMDSYERWLRNRDIIRSSQGLVWAS